MRRRPTSTELRVLRLCSVFRSSDTSFDSGARRFDPIGGMQNHTFELTTRLDQRGVAQTVITARRPGSANRQQIGSRSEIIRVGRPIPYLRQMYAAPAARAARLVAARVDLVHSHLGEDLAVLPIAYQAARRHDLPWIVTVH